MKKSPSPILAPSTISKETSIKLRDLGVPQKSLRYWKDKELISLDDGKDINFDITPSAFNITEMSDMLLLMIKDLQKSPISKKHESKMKSLIRKLKVTWGQDKGLEDVANIMIYVLENKLI